jgi:hypothetical protein
MILIDLVLCRKTLLYSVMYVHVVLGKIHVHLAPQISILSKASVQDFDLVPDRRLSIRALWLACANIPSHPGSHYAKDRLTINIYIYMLYVTVRVEVAQAILGLYYCFFNHFIAVTIQRNMLYTFKPR